MSNAVAMKPEAPVATDMVEMIERLARAPEVDVAKLEKLLEMQERIMAHSARAAFTAALAEMQPRLPVVEKRGKITIKDKTNAERVIQSTPYALWDDISEAIKPILHEHGFSLSFRTGVAGDGKQTVTGVLAHREGHQEETTITLMHDSSGSKNAVQAVGSSISYGKRYTAGALLNLTFRGEDDDGRRADLSAVTDAQVEELRTLFMETGVSLASFYKFFKITKLEELPAARFKEAVDRLKEKVAGK